MTKPINTKVLCASVKMLEKMEQLQRMAQELIRSVDARISVLSEFIRANYTEDVTAFNQLKPVVIENRGNARLFYSKPQYGGRDPDRIRTKQIVEFAQAWARQKEMEDGKATEVPGSPADPASSEGGAAAQHGTCVKHEYDAAGGSHASRAGG